jgi:N-acetylglucosamine kinase-like BadF-type ATPase
LALTERVSVVNAQGVGFFLGIDGGGTRTRAFLVNDSGSEMAWAESGATNPNHVTPEELEKNLRQCISSVFEKLGKRVDECSSCFYGIAGVTTEAGRRQLEPVLRRCGLGHAVLGIDHDIRIALAGGLAGKPGIALIVGTGSSCYGRAADGRTWQTGGWEALISDEGSGYFLGLEAMAMAARMADGRTADSPLRSRVFDWLGITHIVDILPRIHDRGVSRSEIAAFAPEVISMAMAQDAVALGILDRGARLLAEMVEANYRMLSTAAVPQVVITGGLGTADTIYRQKIIAEILRLLPGAQIHSMRLPPVMGAALLAMEQAGHPVEDKLLQELEKFEHDR